MAVTPEDSAASEDVIWLPSSRYITSVPAPASICRLSRSSTPSPSRSHTTNSEQSALKRHSCSDWSALPREYTLSIFSEPPPCQTRISSEAPSPFRSA